MFFIVLDLCKFRMKFKFSFYLFVDFFYVLINKLMYLCECWKFGMYVISIINLWEIGYYGGILLSNVMNGSE